MNYFDKYGRLHHKICIDGEPSGNNGWIFSAYYEKAGGKLDFILLYECFKDCVKQHPSGQFYTIRSPDKLTPPQSRDELLGLAYLGFLKPSHLNGWNFSPFPLPRFSIIKLVKQLWELRPDVYFYGRNFGKTKLNVEWKHRNHFWQNNLDQIYRFAFSVPLQDRAFLLECWGKTKSLRYFFYKGIAMLDAKFGKPKNGIHWLKYGGEERKKIMQAEFPEGHPLREI